jgi:hypothetical protein
MAGGTDINQHKIGSKDMVAVATVMETAAVGAATTAAGMPTTTLGVGTGAETTAVGLAKSAVSAARAARRIWWGVAHIVQYLPPCWRRHMHHIPSQKQRRRP